MHSLKNAMVAGKHGRVFSTDMQTGFGTAKPSQTLADGVLWYSRQKLKKYLLANNKSNVATPAAFDTQFNKALRTGVEKGDFTQPKGDYFRV